MSELVTIRGDCHCGAVTWEADVAAKVEVHACNCSMCERLGYLHLIVPKSRFRLLTGQDELETYSFGTGVAQHTFCRRCGVKSFYTPRSNPDGVSLNARCADVSALDVTVVPFDGQNWEENAGALAHLSQ